jgi:hypothetical protein
MRTNGLYDGTRGLTLALAAGVAGLLLYLAADLGQSTTVRFWESMGLVAAAGLVLALSYVLGSWTKGLRLRLSPGTFLIAFLPVLVCVGWILMATQPGTGWHEATVVSWSNDIGIMYVVEELATWQGVLAFAFGLTLGMTFDTLPVAEPAPAPAPMDTRIADEPVAAEQREAAAQAEPHTVTVGTVADRDRVPERTD